MRARYTALNPHLVAAQNDIQYLVTKLVNQKINSARSGRLSNPDVEVSFTPGIPVIYGRVKDRESCLARIADRHATLEEFPDLIGCRVVILHEERYGSFGMHWAR